MAGLDLQGAGYGLPHVRQTLPDVQHRDVHDRHLDRPVGPQPHVAHGALVRLHVAAAEQLCRPEEGDGRGVQGAIRQPIGCPLTHNSIAHMSHR